MLMGAGIISSIARSSDERSLPFTSSKRGRSLVVPKAEPPSNTKRRLTRGSSALAGSDLTLMTQLDHFEAQMVFLTAEAAACLAAISFLSCSS
jgi:hypothetical protein